MFCGFRLFFYVYERFVCMYVRATHTDFPGALRRVSDYQEVGFQVVVNHRVGARDWTQVFSKSNSAFCS